MEFLREHSNDGLNGVQVSIQFTDLCFENLSNLSVFAI
jgi:hypothetical protein